METLNLTAPAKPLTDVNVTGDEPLCPIVKDVLDAELPNESVATIDVYHTTIVGRRRTMAEPNDSWIKTFPRRNRRPLCERWRILSDAKNYKKIQSSIPSVALNIDLVGSSIQLFL